MVLNTVNVKLSDAQLKKLKTSVKNKTGATLRMRKTMENNGIFNATSSFNKFLNTNVLSK